MKLSKVIAEKKDPVGVPAISADATLRDAGHRLCELRVGALLVHEPNDPTRYVGIISNRDIIGRLCGGGGDFSDPVRCVMTTDLIIATENDDVDYVLRVMIRHHIRQVPVLGKRQVLAVLTMTDLLHSIHADDEIRIQYLQDYLGGTYGNQVF
jgi:CBS domain-containing protein